MRRRDTPGRLVAAYNEVTFKRRKSAACALHSLPCPTQHTTHNLDIGTWTFVACFGVIGEPMQDAKALVYGYDKATQTLVWDDKEFFIFGFAGLLRMMGEHKATLRHLHIRLAGYNHPCSLHVCDQYGSGIKKVLVTRTHLQF